MKAVFAATQMPVPRPFAVLSRMGGKPQPSTAPFMNAHQPRSHTMLSAQQIVALHDRETRAGHEPLYGPQAGEPSDWLALVAAQHHANFELWHIEDEARIPGASNAELADVKRRVDTTNQRRNDLAEQLDRALLGWLAQTSQDDTATREAQGEHPAGAKALVDGPAISARLKSCPDTMQGSAPALESCPGTEPAEGDDLIEHSFSGPLPNPAAPLHSESPGLIIDRLSILALKIYHTREEAERPDAPDGHESRNQQRLAILEEQRADLAACLDELWRETLAGTRRFKLYRQLKMYNDPSLNPAVYRKLMKEQGR